MPTAKRAPASGKGGFSAGELARLLGAELRAASRSASARITGVAELQSASPSDLSFFTNARYKDAFEATRAGAILAPKGTEASGKTLLLCDNPYLAFARAVALFHPEKKPKAGIDKSARVAQSARFGKGVFVGANVSVGERAKIAAGAAIHAGAVVGDDCEIGEGTEIFPNAVLYPRTVLGKRVRVHAGAVLGSDGFGYAFDGKMHVKIPQVGRVRVGDDVEIGAGTTIDRAALGETVIGRGTKIDNLVQIGHNVKIGRNCVIVAQTALAGSVTLGDGVVVAGQVGIAGHLTIGDGAQIAGGSGISNDVPAGAKMAGYPAVTHGDWLRREAALRRMLKKRE